MPTVRTLAHTVTFNDTELDNVLEFNWSLSFDSPVGKASIVLTRVSDAGTYYDDVSISEGGIVRWSGVLIQWDYSLYPRAVTMQCQGRLQLAADYKPASAIAPDFKGFQIEDVVSGGSQTDEN